MYLVLAVCLCHNNNYSRDLRDVLPLPTISTMVICVNYMTTATWHLLKQTLLHAFDTIIKGVCHKDNCLKP